MNFYVIIAMFYIKFLQNNKIFSHENIKTQSSFCSWLGATCFCVKEVDLVAPDDVMLYLRRPSTPGPRSGRMWGRWEGRCHRTRSRGGSCRPLTSSQSLAPHGSNPSSRGCCRDTQCAGNFHYQKILMYWVLFATRQVCACVCVRYSCLLSTDLWKDLKLNDINGLQRAGFPLGFQRFQSPQCSQKHCGASEILI